MPEDPIGKPAITLSSHLTSTTSIAQRQSLNTLDCGAILGAGNISVKFVPVKAVTYSWPVARSMPVDTASDSNDSMIVLFIYRRPNITEVHSWEDPYADIGSAQVIPDSAL